MMALWVMIDDSIQFDELLAGAGAAALAALAAEIVSYQASVRLRADGNGALVVEAAGLPAQLARDTATVFAALVARRPPHGEYTEIPVDDLPPDGAGHVLRTGIRSFAPNTFVVGIDAERQAMLVHRLVAPGGNVRPRENVASRENQAGGSP